MKRSLIIVALLLACVSMQAQKNTIWHKINNLLTKPAVVDTTRIYQPKLGFSLGVFTTGQKAGFDVDMDFGMQSDEASFYKGATIYGLQENMCKKLGLEVGYGKVSLGYGIEVGPKSATKKRAFAFKILARSFGVNFNYYKITNPFVSGITFWDKDGEAVLHDEFSPDQLASLRCFVVDGYYVFNKKRFAYPATYKNSMVQRRTAGSWMLTARYMQGDLFNSPEAAWDSYNLMDCFATMQASLGGGYSVNFVLWHKDPVGQRDLGLRNITVNLTAMPVLTVFNYLKTTSYTYDEERNCIGETVSKMLCKPMPNFSGSAAASLTLGRFYFSTQFTYNNFFFRSRDIFDASQVGIPYIVKNLGFTGAFHDWILKGLLVYRF